MRLSLRGFATLTAMALLLLLTAYLAIGATASAQVEVSLNHAATERGEAWKTLGAALKTLQDSWVPQRQTFSAWARTQPQAGLTWESLSGKMNLNTVSPFILGLPAFTATLKGITVQKFTEMRSLHGPATDGFYDELVQEDALRSWYTVHSLWNFNTADEVMVEAMASQRFGTAAAGSALRATLRSYRSQLKRIGPDDWSRLVGAGSTTLEPVATLEPEIDVNEAAQTLLTALLSNPDWKVKDPAAKAETIVQRRLDNPWTAATLKALLEVPDDNLVLSYLGVRTRFIGGSVRKTGGSLDFVVFLSGDDAAKISPRVVAAAWRKA